MRDLVDRFGWLLRIAIAVGALAAVHGRTGRPLVVEVGIALVVSRLLTWGVRGLLGITDERVDPRP